MVNFKRTVYTLTTAFFSMLTLSCQAQNSSPVIDCDRECLYGYVDMYMEALVEHNPLALPWADEVKFSENGVVMRIPDGLWNTINAKQDYGLMMADPENGQVGWFDVVEEHGHGAIFGGRMKIVDGKIAEVETILSRKVDEAPFPVPENVVTPHPVFLADVPEAERNTRERLISIADGYFDTLQQNNGQLFTEFHDDCDRMENGLITTNTFVPDYPIAAMGCAEQFEKGQYVYDDRLRDRRFPLVDVEKGLVFAAGFIDHSGTIVNYEWTDGTPSESMFFYPHSFVLLELFKIDNGKIRRVEAVFAHANYNMPGVWDDSKF